jgi:2-oxoisovalerate dehydrogenase E2 component (dihydrolipoyl transacylase)
MAERIIKLPDVGEGVAEAELVEWHVKVGDMVREDSILAAVMTDKATVEIPAPADGTVSWLGAEVGETVAVGAPLIRLDVAGEAAGDETLEATPRQEAPDEAFGDEPAEQEAEPEPPPAAKPAPKPEPARPEARASARVAPDAGTAGAPRPEGERPLASPAVRRRAREAGVDLRQVPGTGPAGRIGHEDLDLFIARGRQPAAKGLRRNTEVEEIRVVGLRRRIAERMALAKARIAHITYVEEIDVTALEELRGRLNAEKAADRPRLTMLPFLMRAIVKAVAEQPMVNAHFDDEANVIHRYGGIHIGVATQTDAGLMVPVVRHTEARDLWDCARELNRLTEAAKDGSGARGAVRLDHHRDVARRARRHRVHAGHQSARGGHRRGQQDGNAPGVGRPAVRAAQDDEPVVELRPSGHRRLERGRVRAAHQDAARDPGDDLPGGLSR